MGFFVGEGRELIKYDKASSVPKPGDVGLEFLPQNDPDNIEVAAGLSSSEVGEFKRPENGWVQQFLVDPAGLRRDGFEGDLRVAAPNVERRIDILVPDGSHLFPSNPVNVSQALRDLVATELESLDLDVTEELSKSGSIA